MNYKDQITPDQGAKKLLDFNIEYKYEEIQTSQTFKRVLAQDMYAKIDVPSFDKSPFDGYALRGEDTEGASEENPIRFEITEEIPAGSFPKKEVGKFQAAKILTGGPLPKGANTTIKFEKTDFTENQVFIKEELKANSNVVKQGEDIEKASLLLEKGSILDSPSLGLLASQGIEKIKVYKKPKLGFFLTGSELKELGENLDPGEIYDSNHLTFLSLFENLGFEVEDYGLVGDDLEEITRLTKEANESCDLLITTGGASVGDYDYGARALENLGGQVLFTKTAMKPGGSLVVSKLREKAVINLSGNPGAAILGLFRVCLPFLKKTLGRKEIYSPSFQALLKEPFDKENPRLRLLRGTLEYQDGKVYFVEDKNQGNGILSSFVGSKVFGEIPPGVNYLGAGQLIKVYDLENLFS